MDLETHINQYGTIQARLRDAIGILCDAHNLPLSETEDQAVTVLCDLLFDVGEYQLAAQRSQ